MTPAHGKAVDMSSDGGEQSTDDMQDGNWAGVARSTGSSCRGNLRLTPKLKIGEIFGNGTKAGDGGDWLASCQQIWIIGQHACLISAAHPWYYIIEPSSEGGLETIQEVWVLWKG